MASKSASLLDVAPPTPAPLDPGFRPAFLANQAYRKAAKAAKGAEKVCIAVERENGLVARYDTAILPWGGRHDAETERYVERTIKFLLWARGGWRLHLAGPEALCQSLAATYSPAGARAFDTQIMERAYDQPLVTRIVPPEQVPAGRESGAALGGHFEGCRIGFDLGASDFKLAAVMDGEAVFSAEIPWQPSTQADPMYHVTNLREGLKQAASHLPRVDAIGGSSAGVYVDNQPKVASLFRSVPVEDFRRVIQPMFQRFAAEWNVPVVVLNDGDVTALAGAITLERTAVLGVAMGSSEAAGYIDPDGRVLGWLSELAFAPVDLNPAALPDEWSGDRGVGALYFSQQAVNRLAPAAGLEFPAELKLPERLVKVQELVAKGHAGARRIFESIGVYLGYSVPHYADFYDFETLMVLGRVTSGSGGEILLDTARDLLRREFPAVAERVDLHVPDERSRRVGQAVAAASLPELPARKG